MTRVIQLDLGDDTPRHSFRRDMMALDKADVVLLLEDATAKEIAATAMVTRLMQRVATAEQANRDIDRRWHAQCEAEVAYAWQEATGGIDVATEVLLNLLDLTVTVLVSQSSRNRAVLGKIQVGMLESCFEALDAYPDGDTAEAIAKQFYAICRMIDYRATGPKSSHWFSLGQQVYTAQTYKSA